MKIKLKEAEERSKRDLDQLDEAQVKLSEANDQIKVLKDLVADFAKCSKS